MLLQSGWAPADSQQINFGWCVTHALHGSVDDPDAEFLGLERTWRRGGRTRRGTSRGNARLIAGTERGHCRAGGTASSWGNGHAAACSAGEHRRT